MTRIAIIGGGPGGLLCARMLQERGIPAAVYEADASVESRDPGGSLDLHADSGQIALQDAGLFERFLTLARFEDQAKRNLDHHATVLSSFVPDAGDTAAPEIDRGQLRAMLADSLHPDTIRWGHKLVTTTTLRDGVHRLRFENGVTVDVDLVVGADGVWSRVRTLVTDTVPIYTGVSFLDVHFDDADTRHRGIAELVGAGHLFANDGAGRAIIAQRNSGGRIRGYVAMRTDVDWCEQAGLDLDDRTALREYLVREFAGWSEELIPLLTDSDGYVDRAIFVQPSPLIWRHTPGVTLIGDAAHAMSPFGGHGVNLALLDGAELARAIAEEPSTDSAISRYEARMFSRSGDLAVDSDNALAMFFGLGDGLDDDMPDHAAEHRRYQEAALAYRRDEITPITEPLGTITAEAAQPVDGTWRITYRAAGGEKTATIVLAARDGRLTGTFDGNAIQDGRVDELELSFTARITSPFTMKMKCTATVEADAITGTAKVPMMSFPFTGVRDA